MRSSFAQELFAAALLTQVMACTPADAPTNAVLPDASGCAAVRVKLPLRDVAPSVAVPAARSARWSADGAHLVFERDTATGSQIVLAAGDGANPRAITAGTAEDRDPDFDHDGNVVFSSNREGTFDLFTVPREGGTPRRITSLPGDERHPHVSPRPYEVVYGTSGQQGKHGTVLARFHKVVYEHCSKGSCGIAFSSLDGTTHHPLTQHGDCRHPRWAPSGRELALECDGKLLWIEVAPSRRGYLQRPDDERSTPPSWREAASVLTADPPLELTTVATFDGFAHADISPNGVWMLAEREKQLWALHRNGKQQQLTSGPSVVNASWSSDGSRARFVADDTELCTAKAELPLTDVANLWSFPELYDGRRDDLLDRNRFAVFDIEADGFDGSQRELLDDAAGAPQMAPSERGDLITSDAILNVMHDIFAAGLIEVERELLIPRLRKLLAALVQRAAAAARSESDRRLAIHLGVAQALASHETIPTTASSAPRSIRPAVEGVLALIESKSTSADSVQPIAALALDPINLSDLQPRGHYERDGMRGFFRAMMWLSRARLENAEAARKTYHLLRRAKLYPAYAEIYALYELFVGRAEDGSPMSFADPDASRQAAQPEILGPSSAPTNRHFYVFPARWTPDAMVLQRLSFSNRSRAPRKPSSLDVMAVLGSHRAELHAPNKTTHPYATELATLRAAAANDFSDDGAYGSWLGALQTLVRPPTATLPPFAQTDAYRDKLLHTALASYAALKHDTLLATKPPRVRMGGSHYDKEWLYETQLIPRRLVYIEPTPGLYERLAVFAERGSVALRAMGPDGVASAKRFERAREMVLLPLAAALATQLAGEPLSDAQHEDVSMIRSFIERNWRYGRGKTIVGNERGSDEPCLIADIFSVDATRTVHAIAIGNVLPMAAVVPHEGRQLLTVGGVYSFHELDVPWHTRPTDAQWCSRVSTDAPPRPQWTTTFMQR